MTNAGERLIAGATEALAVARGEEPAASIVVNGHRYVPASEISRLQKEIETAREREQRLQAALSYWMPQVSEKIEIELNGRAGDDALLLYGYEGEAPANCWGETMVQRIEDLEKALANDRDESLWRFWNGKARDLAAKLETAREDALEEAAKAAERVGQRGTDDLIDREWTTEIVAKEIRSLKSKEAADA